MREGAQFAPLPRIRSSAASVEAKPAGTECDDLQETAGHCDILEEVDELALVRQVAVEAKCRRHREDRQNRRDEPRTITHDQRCAAENFDNHGNGKSKRSEGKPGGCDVADRGGRRGELREPGNQINCAEQYPVPVGNLIRLASEAESRNISIL
jgi:hypothetical protein